MLFTGDLFGTTLHEGRRVTDAIGWTIILLPYLAALGTLFGIVMGNDSFPDR